MMKFQPVPVAAALLLTLGVAACTQQDWPWEDRGPTVAQPRTSDAFPPPEPRPARAAAVTRQPKATEKRPAAAVRVEPARLVGLSEQETADLLGRPAEEAEQPPGKVWVYKASGCRLSVHLFPDMEKGGFYALDYTAEEGSGDICLGKLAMARKKE